MWLNAVEDPNIKDEFGRTPLSLSGINSKSSYCLSSYPISNDFLNLDRNQPSKLNSILQTMNVIEYIIGQSTCSTCCMSMRIANCVRHIAALMGHVEIAKSLLDFRDCNCNAIDGHGRTPLGVALSDCDQAIVLNLQLDFFGFQLS